MEAALRLRPAIRLDRSRRSERSSRSWRGVRALPRQRRRRRARTSTRRSRASAARRCSGSASSAPTAGVYAAGRRRRRVHDHERLEAVRLRARLRGARARARRATRLGVNATGLPFNSLTAVEQSADGRTNPMVNPGAIATTSLVPGRAWRALGARARRASRASPAASSRSTTRSTARPRRRTRRNRGLARLLAELRPARRRSRPRRSTSTRASARCRDRDTTSPRWARRSPTAASTRSPASASSTEAVCRYTLAVMTTAGLYETSGDWLYDVGLPGKSGIGGGIVTVAPGKGGLGTFAPLLDDGRQQRQGAARGAVPLAAARPRPARLESRSQ